MKIILGILLAGILSNNIAFMKLLGTGAVIEKAYSAKKSLLLGLGTTIVMVLCTLITGLSTPMCWLRSPTCRLWPLWLCCWQWCRCCMW